MVYTVPDCVQVNSKTGLLNYQNIRLPLDACVDVKGLPFLSFQGRVQANCTNTQTQKGIVIAFFGEKCGGSSSPVSSRQLPANGSSGPCEDVLLGSSADDPEAGGRSVLFSCVDKVPGDN